MHHRRLLALNAYGSLDRVSHRLALRSERRPDTEPQRDAPDKNRTCAHGLGNRCRVAEAGTDSSRSATLGRLT